MEVNSKSELKRRATLDPLWAAARIHLLESALRDIPKWEALTEAMAEWANTRCLPDNMDKWDAAAHRVLTLYKEWRAS